MQQNHQYKHKHQKYKITTPETMTEGRKRQSATNDLCYKLHFSKCFHISANFSVSRFCKADNYLLASPFNIGNPKSVCTFHQGGHQCTRCTRFTMFNSSSATQIVFSWSLCSCIAAQYSRSMDVGKPETLFNRWYLFKWLRHHSLSIGDLWGDIFCKCLEAKFFLAPCP